MDTTTLAKRLAAVVAVVGLVAALAACESSGTEPASAPPAVTEPSPEPAPEPEPEPTVDPEASEATDEIPEGVEPGLTGDPVLDDLWMKCESGDMESCDSLFWNAPADSAAEEFGATCGGRADPEGWCGAEGGLESDEGETVLFELIAPSVVEALPAEDLASICEGIDMLGIDPWLPMLRDAYEEDGEYEWLPEYDAIITDVLVDACGV